MRGWVVAGHGQKSERNLIRFSNYLDTNVIDSFFTCDILCFSEHAILAKDGVSAT